MANSQSNPDQIDRLSALPDALLVTVLSLLPTCKAARTSVISRRFRHLWKSSPSVDLSIEYLPFNRSTYISMVNSALLGRSSSNHLLRLHLDLDYPVSSYNLIDSFFCFLLVHAYALGLRHLTIDGYCKPVLRSVFSISSLESLSISIRPLMSCPSAMALIRLKSLSINLTTYSSKKVQRLLSELCCLEYLQLRMYCGVDCLSSRTVKKLELLLFYTSPAPYSLGLSMPSLEFLLLKNLSIPADIPLIHGEIPLIRKVVVTLDCLREKHVTAVARFLNCISHVEELSLDLKENIVIMA